MEAPDLVVRRAQHTHPFAAHTVEHRRTAQGVVEEYKTSAVVVDHDLVGTYAHKEHAHWSAGDVVPVWVHDAEGAGRRREVRGSVVYKNLGVDLVLLKVESLGQGPVLDSGIMAGMDYYVHGQSTQAQADASSLSHGMISATELDQLGHIRGDTKSGHGDSGGGCFLKSSGKLIGMIVGQDDRTEKVVMIPAAGIAVAVEEVRRKQQEQA